MRPPRALPGVELALTPITKLPFLLWRESRKRGPYLRFALGPLPDVYYVGTPATVEQVLVASISTTSKTRSHAPSTTRWPPFRGSRLR